MPTQFDHVGVVVADIAAGREHFQSLFGVEEWTEVFPDPVNGVYVQFGRDKSGTCYELVTPLGAESPIARALKAGNPILNHIAYLTDDLAASAADLRTQRCIPATEPRPAVAYNGKNIQFFVSPLRFIVELIEAFDHRHEFVRGLR